MGHKYIEHGCPFTYSSCIGSDEKNRCKINDEPCKALPDIVVDHGNCHLELRSWLMTQKEFRHALDVIMKMFEKDDPAVYSKSKHKKKGKSL